MRILLYLSIFLYSVGLSAQITLTSSPSCQGIGSGSILVEATEDPTVVWDDVVTISCEGLDNDFFHQEETDGSTGILNYTIHSVPPGLYEVEIFFSSTCDAIDQITVGAKQATLSYNPAVTGVYQGFNNGSIILNDFLYLDHNGSIPIQAPTFEWRNQSSDIVGTFQNLSNISYPGIYCLTITSDLCGPHKECFYVGYCDNNMIEPSASYVVDADCADGLFDFTVPLINTANRVPPFIIEWDDGYIGQTRWNLSPGSFNVTVSDQSACSSFGHFDVEYSAPPIDGQIVSSKDFVSCDNNASLTYETNVGAISDFTYLWSNGSTNHEISNLGEGIYTLQVENSSGCVRNFSYEIRNLGETISINKINHITDCTSNDDGSVVFNNNSGRDLYLYLTRIDIGVGYPMGVFSGSQFSAQNLPSGDYRYSFYNLDEEGERGNCVIKSGVFELCCCNNNEEAPGAYQCQNTIGFPPVPETAWNYTVTPDISGSSDGAIIFNFDGLNLPPEFIVYAEHAPSGSTYESATGSFQNLPSGWYDLHFDYSCDGRTYFEIYVPGCQEQTELYLERTYIHDQGVNCDPEPGQSSSPYINFKLPKFENRVYGIYLNDSPNPIYEGQGTNATFLHKLATQEIINNKVHIQIVFDNGCIHEFTIDIEFKEVRYEYDFYDSQIGACVWKKYCGDQEIGTTITFSRNMNLESKRKCKYSFDCIPPSNNSEDIIRVTTRCNKLKTSIYHYKLIAQNHPNPSAYSAALAHAALRGANDCDRIEFCSCTLQLVDIDTWPGDPVTTYVDEDGCTRIICSRWLFDDHKECPGSILYVRPTGDYDISYERCLQIVTIDFVNFLHYEEEGYLDTYFPGLSTSNVMDQINSFRNLESHFQSCLRFKICLNNKGEYFFLGSNLESLQQADDNGNGSNDWINVTHSDGSTSLERYFSQVSGGDVEGRTFLCPCDNYIPRPESCDRFPAYRVVGFPGNTYETIFGNAFGPGGYMLSAYRSTLNRKIKSRGIENSSGSVILYPNPSYENSINLVSIQSSFSWIRISSLQGKTIIDLNFSTAKSIQKLNVDISSLPSGTYFVQSKLNSGILVNNKFVKL